MTKSLNINGTPVTFRGSNGRVDARADFTSGAKMIGFVNGLEKKGLKMGKEFRVLDEGNCRWIVALNMAATDILKLARA